jgi:hypothetical protein
MNLTNESIKSITSYRSGLRSAVRALWLGLISPEQFEGEMRSIINRRLNEAFDEGAKQFGVTPDEYTQQEWLFIANTINSEMGHVPGLANDVSMNSKANGGKLTPLLARMDNWIPRYNDVKNRAIAMIGSDVKLEWILGFTSQHCSTCVRLNGKVKRGSQWDSAGILPQNPPNPILECGGWRCQCSLQQTDKPMSRGPLPRR